MPHLSLSEAEALCISALRASRVSEPNADDVATALVRAEADGQRGHGLSRIPSYCAQSRSGKVNGTAVPHVEAVRSGLLRVDAGLGFAYPAISKVMPSLRDAARTQGIACAVVHRSHHFGVAGHHCERLADQGLVGMIYGNSPKAMAPWGGREALLGTNPVAFAAPMPDAPPLVIDMATSQVARGKILAARENGQATIPEGWAFDRDGNPTTDTEAALAGSVAPMGGAKGAAIALMIEIMAGALTGAAFASEATSLFDGEGAPPNLGQVLIAVDPELSSAGAYFGRMRDLAALYDQSDGVRFPGTSRLSARARAATEGLSVTDTLLQQVRAISGT